VPPSSHPLSQTAAVPPSSHPLPQSAAVPPLSHPLSQTAAAPPSSPVPPAATAAAAPPPPPPPPPREALMEPPAPPIGANLPRTQGGPRTALPPGLAPAGDLATTPLPRLIFELCGSSFCGALELKRKGSERIIDIWNGIPVAMHVIPAPVGDDLASLLREHGRITPEQAEDAETRAPGREAQLLVALGVIDERDLLDVIREQTELRLAATFAWRDGTYVITPSKEPPDSIVLSEVHPIKVIWRGVSEHYDAASLLQFFSTLRSRYLVATQVFPIHYETLGPFLRSAGITKLLDGHTTFEQALRSDDSKALLIAQCLYVLIVTEMIRARPEPGKAAIFPDAVVKSKAAQPVDYRELARACEDIAHTYLAMKERDYFQMLELQRTATDRDIVAAHERLVQPFLVENLMPGLPEDVVRRAREIEEMLNRAHDTLISAEERRRYVQRLGASDGSAEANV
jgi:hypothetical protein